MFKKILVPILLIVGSLQFTGCTDAELASRNLTKAADMFELERRIIFYDAIQGSALLVIEGRCSLSSGISSVTVTCKTGQYAYKKHHLGLSDNVTFFSEQLENAEVDIYHYRVILKPSALIPDIEVH